MLGSSVGQMTLNASRPPTRMERYACTCEAERETVSDAIALTSQRVLFLRAPQLHRAARRASKMVYSVLPLNAGFFCAAAARGASARGAQLRYATRSDATQNQAAPARVPSSSMRPAQMCWQCASRTHQAARDERVACVRARSKAEIGWQGRARAASDAAEARSHLRAALRRRVRPVTARSSAHLRQRRRQACASGARAWRLLSAACAPAA